MTQYAYPFDPLATNPANLVSNESYKLTEYPNKWKCIIPRYAPFYRLGLKLRDSVTGKQLYEGIDYYLGHYFKEASEGNRIATYGSVMMVTARAEDTIIFEQYRTVGGRHNILATEINTYLAKVDNGDPRNVDWAEVPTFRKPLAPVSPPDDIAEAILKDGPTGELQVIANKLIALGNAEKDAFELLIADLTSLDERLVDEDIENHHRHTDPHTLSLTELNAVAKTGVAADTTLAYKHTISQLVAYVKSLSITPAHVESLIKLAGDEFFGRITMIDGHLVLSNTTGGSIVDIDNGEWTIYATSETLVHADSDNNEVGIAAAISASMNKLTVHSGGSATSAKGVVYNGHYLVAAGSVSTYVTEPNRLDYVLRTQNTATVTMAGEGSVEYPLNMAVIFPVATLTAAGIFELSHSLDRQSTTVAASAFAIDRLRKIFDKLTPLTRKVNGIPLSSNITLDADDIGLGRVNNTAPDVKPASNAFINAVANLADKVHTHPWSDVINIDYSTTALLGITKLHDKIENLHDRGIQVSAVNGLATDILNVIEDNKKKLPAYPLDVTQYGGFSYLPAPVLGGYGAAGLGEFVGAAAAVEADGKVVMLRNGGDVYERGVYYWYVNLNSAGSLLSVVPTTTEYTPPYLTAGERIRYIGPNGEGVFLTYTSNGRALLVLTRGTMDSASHIAAPIDMSDMPMARHLQMTIYKDHVYFVLKDYGNNYSIRVWKVALSAVESGANLVPEVVILHGVDATGTMVYGMTIFYYTKTGLSADPSTNPIMLDQSAGRWNGINVRHAGQNTNGVRKDNMFRLLTYAGIYASNSYTSGTGAHSTSVLIDLDYGLVNVENRGDYPIIATASGGFVASNGRLAQIPWPGANPNNSSFVMNVGDRMFSVSTYGTLQLPVIYEIINPAGGTSFDHMKYDAGGYGVKWGSTFEGLYGSVAKAGSKNIGFLDNNQMIMDQLPGDTLKATYDVNGSFLDDGSGWGPTTVRESLSRALGDQLKRVPRMWHQNKNAGAVFFGPEREFFSGVTNGVPHTPLVWPQGVYNSVKAALASLIPGMFTAANFVDESIILTMFGAHTDATRTAFISWDVLRYVDGTNTAKQAVRSLLKCTVNFSGANISSVSLGTILIDQARWSNSSTSISGQVVFNQPSMAINSAGEKVYIISPSAYVSYVGNASAYSVVYIELANGTSSILGPHTVYYYQANGYTYHPDFGIASISNHSTGEGMYYSARGFTVADWNSGNSSSALLHATRVASGWIVYFTEESRFYHNRVSYMMPIQSLNVATYSGLGDYKNKKLYLFVNMSTGTPRYVIYTTKVADSSVDFYIGYIQTDQFRIIDIQVERATRIGRTYELEKHMGESGVHDSLKNQSLEGTAYSNLENWTLTSSMAFAPTVAQPDAYASIDMMTTLQQWMKEDFHITSGTCTHGNRIPLPRDFKYSDCKVLVTYREDPSAGGLESMDVRITDNLFTVQCLRNGVGGVVDYTLFAARRD